MRELLRICLLPLALSNLICHAYCGELGSNDGGSKSTTNSETGAAGTNNTTTATTTLSVTTLGNATCLSRTANYITHTLPQQCLRTDRVAANATQNNVLETQGIERPNSNATDSPSASGTSIAPPTGTSSMDSAATAKPSIETPTESSYDAEVETDSPLDNANFLSFEEWKMQNLAKSGQSPENVGNGRTIEGIRERPINNALESYGDEEEIDLDFSGFGGEASAARASSRESQTGVSAVDAPTGELVPALRSKDAGKTCKERTNYASFDCAANVLKSNPECKSSSAVLVENKDSYMLNTCSVKNKFFIVELCDDILIDTIVLANYEFFSSIFRHFRLSVSDRYPVKIDKWKDLGTFEARNVRDVQAFLVERPQIWARYLRIEFLSHYGSEYYCPVSLLRVHGTTMLEDYRHQEEIARGDHTEEATLDVEVNATPALAQEPITSTDEASKETLSAIESLDAAAQVSSSSTSMLQVDSANTTKVPEPAPTSPTQNATVFLSETQPSAGNSSTCALDMSPSETSIGSTGVTEKASASATPLSTSTQESSTSVAQSPASSSNETQTLPSSTESSGQTPAPSNEVIHDKSTGSMSLLVSSAVEQSRNDSASNQGKTSSPSQVASTSSSITVPAASASSSPTNSTRSSASPTVAAPPQAATQESFYKSVHKRLQKLESNSTLSLQYIEEQSRILRDAFSKVEKRQIAATTSFLTNLNSTVMAELQGFRQAYDQLWQSTVIELEGQREQYQREMLAMGSRLTLVADELVWQKRMGIVQSTLLLLCLGLVLFSRQGNGYLEMPLMQQMVHRSQTALARAGWESPLESPSPMSRSPVSLFRRKLWRSHTEPASGNVTDATDSRPESKDGSGLVLEVNVAPPTPPRDELNAGSGDGGGHGGYEVESNATDVDEEAFEDVWESRSGPATPRGTREGSLSAGEVGWLDPGASGAIDDGLGEGR